MKIKNKNIAVIGFGVEGTSSAKYLSQYNTVTVRDNKPQDSFNSDLINSLSDKGVKFIFGQNYLDGLDNYDLIVRSPGVRIDTIEKVVESKKIPITSQTEIFLRSCPCIVIGVTGTKGKGTTASLISEMLNKSEIKTYLGGNIGKPPFEFLDDLKESDRVVLELSSFQLMGLTKSPEISVLLMMTSEHLDYHLDLQEYIDAKRNILRHQADSDIAIINRDYPPSNESDIYSDGKIFHITTERDRVQEEGCFIKENSVYVSMNGSEWSVIDISNIALFGRHNLENVCAATMAATLAGADKESIASVLATFKGLPHRLELVRAINNVDYFDDSFSTTPETAIAAIKSFDRPEILILGGSSKNSDFTELGRVISEAENIKAIIGIGEEWERIKAEIDKAVIAEKKEVPIVYIEGASSMEQVVKAAHKLAKPGDTVLLSPACASFGMFENYKDRGEQFKKEVNNLT